MKKKLAIVRGSNLNKWEMQNYENLTRFFDVTAFSASNSFFDTSGIMLKIKELPSPEKAFCRIPGAISLSKAASGSPQMLLGLEAELEDFDLVHTACLESAYTRQCIEAKKDNPKLKVVATIWENIPFTHERFKKQAELKRQNIKGVDLFLAMSKRAAFALEAEGVPKEKIEVFYVGIDVERFSPRKKDTKFMRSLGIEENDFVVTSVARLVYEKGILDVLVAVAELIKKNERVKYLIVGEGPLKKRIEELSERLGIREKIIITTLDYQDIPRALSLSDIFVVPSIPIPRWQEQLGMALIEAMSSGVPVISSLSGSIDEVVAEAGILVAPGDSYQIKLELQRLYESQALRDEFSRRGRERVLRMFDANKKSEQLAQIYQKVL
ncbi:glycosyltransferase family 4 protein [Patescibacteria group bacterium]|nr:glycosyltransferase family 4 protein [Patescibacteria group bacterium]